MISSCSVPILLKQEPVFHPHPPIPSEKPVAALPSCPHWCRLQRWSPGLPKVVCFPAAPRKSSPSSPKFIGSNWGIEPEEECSHKNIYKHDANLTWLAGKSLFYWEYSWLMVFQMSKKQMGSSFIEDNYIEEGPSQPTQLYQPPKRQSEYLNPTMSTQSTPTEKRKKTVKNKVPRNAKMRPGFRMPFTAPWAESWGGRRDPPGHCLQWSRSPVRRWWMAT